MISKHITYAEAIKSQTAVRKGIKNAPNIEELENMKYVANEIFEPLRLAMGGKPLTISSFFRSVALNKAIGGSSSSQHCRGEAMDIDADGAHVTNREVFEWIKENCAFDQLIFEFRKKDFPDDCEWVHVSLKRHGSNRFEILEAYKDMWGKTKYKKYPL